MLEIRKDRRAILTTGFAISALALAGCDGMIFPYVRRFRYEITIAFNGREYTGSSVYEVQWGRNPLPDFDAAGDYFVHVGGQAPFVVIPKTGVVFGLITPPPNSKGFRIADTAAALATYSPPELRKNGGYDEFLYLMNLSGAHELQSGGDQMPIAVFFPTPSNFMNVQIVPSGGLAVAGSDIFLVQATLSITDDQITHKITPGVLPTFDGHRIHPPYHFVPGTPFSEQPLGGQITSECFILEGLR